MILFMLFHTKKRKQLLKKYDSMWLKLQNPLNLKDTNRQGADVEFVSLSGF